MIKEGKFTLLEKRGAVAKITINRPEKRNALSRDDSRNSFSFRRTAERRFYSGGLDHRRG
jgi:enoyl-CoA hydratase/carnithine racemase